MWKGYVGLKNTFTTHKVMNHSLGFKNPSDGTHANTIEGTWCAVKQQTPLRARTKGQISLYLVRFMILRNDPGDPLINLLNYLFVYCSLALKMKLKGYNFF